MTQLLQPSISGFVSNRGKAFDNQLMDDRLEAFGIIRSLSQAGCPYDNAVAESTTVLSRLILVIKNHFQHWKSLRSRQETTLIVGTITAFTIVSITKHLWPLESSPNQIHFIKVYRKRLPFQYDIYVMVG